MSRIMADMDYITGPFAYEEAKRLGILKELKTLRKNVAEKRKGKIQGTFVGILRSLGNEMQRKHGKFGER